MSPEDWPPVPEFSLDGECVYYSRSDQGQALPPDAPDGSQDQAVAFLPGSHAAPTLSLDSPRMAVVNHIPDRIEIHTPFTRQVGGINPHGSSRRIVALDPESQAVLEYRVTGIGAPAARPR